MCIFFELLSEPLCITYEIFCSFSFFVVLFYSFFASENGLTNVLIILLKQPRRIEKLLLISVTIWSLIFFLQYPVSILFTVVVFLEPLFSIDFHFDCHLGGTQSFCVFFLCNNMIFFWEGIKSCPRADTKFSAGCTLVGKL